MAAITGDRAGANRPVPTAVADWKIIMISRILEFSLRQRALVLLGAVPIATYVELQKQYLEAVEALLDTRREALEAGQQIRLLTGMDFNAGQTNKERKDK